MLYQEGDLITPEQAMRFAIEVAKQGTGFVSPNPLVGCVIVGKDGKYLSSGAHLKFGEAHAEINAINNISDSKKLEGASLYVTLEPCAHQGKTGSCAEAISKLPISKVYYGALDPNPLVAGQGIEKIRRNNKLVEHFDQYERQCKELSEQFFFHIKNNRPFVSLKVATSLDGKIALESGESQWITGEEARVYARQLRAHYDATIISTGTLRHDNPTLDFRDTAFAGKKENKIIILDPKGKGSENFTQSNIYKNHNPKNIYILTRAEYVNQWSKHLVHVLKWESSKSSWDEVLNNLYQRGIASLYIEGGSFVYGQFLQYGFVNKIYLFQSPMIMGKGVSWTQYFDNPKLSSAIKLKNWNSLVMGEDRLNIAYI